MYNCRAKKAIGQGQAGKNFFLICAISLILAIIPFQESAGVMDVSVAKRESIADLPQYSGLVINARTGEVLYSKNATHSRYPASLTKMMSLYLIFDALRNGDLTLQQKMKVSKLASEQLPSKLGLKARSFINVQNGIDALIVKSANDVAYVFAEVIAGSAQNFTAMMTAKARKLGMTHTRFRNPSGWYDPNQTTTAYDMAKLAMALRAHHGKYYHLFKKTSFVFRGKVIKGHNKVLQMYRGADGIKTGFVGESGFNLVTSTNRPEGQLVAVVMGAPSLDSRDRHMLKLLEYGYRKMKNSGHAPVSEAAEYKVNRRKTNMLFAKKVSVFSALEGGGSAKYRASNG